MYNFTYKTIDETNLSYALQIQHRVFNFKTAATDYLTSLNIDSQEVYWMVYKGDTCIGISGMSRSKEDPTCAWLKWFGVLPEYRYQGYGVKILQDLLNRCESLDYSTVRVQTDFDHALFFLRQRMVCEPYEDFYIASMSLDPDKSVVLWRDVLKCSVS